jgi:hypothetical protein
VGSWLLTLGAFIGFLEEFKKTDNGQDIRSVSEYPVYTQVGEVTEYGMFAPYPGDNDACVPVLDPDYDDRLSGAI